MLTENDVVEAVSSFLTKNGYSIDKALNTRQQGIDIEATAPSGLKCFVEAKGATSSKRESSRYGKEFDNNQVKTHVGVALLKSFQTLHKYKSSEVVIALPNNKAHRSLVESIYSPIKASGIRIFLVNQDGTVDIFI